MKTIVMAGVLIGVMMGSSVAGKRSEAPLPDVESEVMSLLDDYMNAWNRKDLVAWERTFHFPHYRLASGKMNVLDRPGLQDAARVWGSAGSGWHHSKWDRRRIIIRLQTRFTSIRSSRDVARTAASSVPSNRCTS